MTAVLVGFRCEAKTENGLLVSSPQFVTLAEARLHARRYAVRMRRTVRIVQVFEHPDEVSVVADSEAYYGAPDDDRDPIELDFA